MNYPVIGRCSAIVPKNAYRAEGQCEKRYNLEKNRGKLICAVHRKIKR